MIKQSTGEDWENASIALSTAQPDVGGSPPRLGVHFIGFKQYSYVATGLALKRRGKKSKKKAAHMFPPRNAYDREDRYSLTLDIDDLEEEGEGLMMAGFIGDEVNYRGAPASSSRRRRRSLASFSDGSDSSSMQSLEVDVTKVHITCQCTTALIIGIFSIVVLHVNTKGHYFIII